MARPPKDIGITDTGTELDQEAELAAVREEIAALKSEVRTESARFDEGLPARGIAAGGPIDPRERGRDTANTVYILYLVNYLVPFLGIVGVIMAYNGRATASPELQSHYDNQIRIFWISFIGYAVSFVLMFVLVGFITGLLVAVWKAVRTITGMTLLGRGAPVRNVPSYNFASE